MKKKIDFDFVIGAVLTGIVLLLMVVSFIHSPYDPDAIDVIHRFNPPSLLHPLGTDNFGRDILSRIMVGTRYTLMVAVSTILISTFLGIAMGLAAGFLGGITDEVIMRFNDALTSFPSILLALMLVTVLGQGETTLILALGIVFTPSFARIVRSSTLQFKEREFVKSSQVMGASHLRIMFIHILPNVYPALLSAVTIGFSNAILAEASMSFLGFGIQPPRPSWGRMLLEAQTFLFNAPWAALAPGVMIMVTVLGFNFLGEGLRKNIL